MPWQGGGAGAPMQHFSQQQPQPGHPQQQAQQQQQQLSGQLGYHHQQQHPQQPMAPQQRPPQWQPQPRPPQQLAATQTAMNAALRAPPPDVAAAAAAQQGSYAPSHVHNMHQQPSRPMAQQPPRPMVQQPPQQHWQQQQQQPQPQWQPQPHLQAPQQQLPQQQWQQPTPAVPLVQAAPQQHPAGRLRSRRHVVSAVFNAIRTHGMVSTKDVGWVRCCRQMPVILQVCRSRPCHRSRHRCLMKMRRRRCQTMPLCRQTLTSWISHLHLLVMSRPRCRQGSAAALHRPQHIRQWSSIMQ